MRELLATKPFTLRGQGQFSETQVLTRPNERNFICGLVDSVDNLQTSGKRPKTHNILGLLKKYFNAPFLFLTKQTAFSCVVCHGCPVLTNRLLDGITTNG